MISKGDKVIHLKKSHRGVGIVKALKDGKATIHYPTFNLTVMDIRVRDLKKES